jgi:ferredoxin
MRIEHSAYETTDAQKRPDSNPGRSPHEHTPTRPVKLLILFFSGTGNTQFVAEYLKDRVLKDCAGVQLDVTLAAMEWSVPDIVARYDLVCIGCPVYEGRAPRVVREHVERFPAVSNTGAFVFNTKGLAQGRANRSIARMLEKKGFRPLGSASLVMPASDGISMFMKRDSRKFQELSEREYRHLPDADTLATRISHAIRHLVSGEPVSLLDRDAAVAPFGFLLTGFFRLLYSALGESAAKKLRTSEQCTTCGHCVRTCPMQNISIDNGRVVFGNNCVFCLRCVNNCPQEAVQVGKLSVAKARWHGPRGEYSPLRYRTPKVFRPASE